MAKKPVVNQRRFQSLGGTTRRYLDLKTGETISRREALKRSTGMTPEALAASRAAREPRPNLSLLRKRLESMTRRGFKSDDIAHRSRTLAPVTGRAGRTLRLRDLESRETISAGTVKDILRGKTAVSEQRAAQVLKALEKHEFSYAGTLISPDGRLSQVTLVGEDSILNYFRYFNALKGLSEGDASRFDRLKPSDFEVRIIGPSGNVETYTLNKNKEQLRRDTQRIPLKEFELPDPETRRYLK